MQITGLMNNQVLQRNAKNFCEVTICGQCAADGLLQVRVTGKGRTVPGFTAKTIAKVQNKKFTCKLRGIPVGGPYHITLKLLSPKAEQNDQLEFKNILVGDVWILAGQSNMEGIGRLKDAASPHRMVRAFYMNDRWDTAKDPIHNIGQAVDQVHTDLNGGTPADRGPYVGVGPGVAFGKEMYRLTNVPQGLISCAHGGTSMSQWDPKLKNLKGKSLYGAMLRRFNNNGANVAGMIWYQGCSDAGSSETKVYTQRMKKFVSSVRRDFNDKNMPVTIVQIARIVRCDQNCEIPDYHKYWNNIQEQQRLMPKAIDKLAVVPAIDLTMDDGVHISGKDQQRLGKRLASTALMQKIGRKAGKAPIEVGSVTSKIDKVSQCWIIEVAFFNVEGSLKSPGRPAGFNLVHSDNKECKLIYAIELKANKAILKTSLLATEKHPVLLHYGFGTLPYCNITDSADRSLPAFGPMKIAY